MKAQLTDYGKAIKFRLIEIGKDQAWLIDEVKKKTSLYFDSAYLWRIQTGQLSTPKIVAAINEILGLDELLKEDA